MTWTREPVVERNTRPPHGGTWAVSDARVAAALNFAGLFFQGSGVSRTDSDAEKDALYLARLALALFEEK